MRTFILKIVTVDDEGVPTTHTHTISVNGVPTPSNLGKFVTWYVDGQQLGYNADYLLSWHIIEEREGE